MARQRKAQAKAKDEPVIKLAHPDRDGTKIGGKTFIELAEERQLMQQADEKMAANKAKANNGSLPSKATRIPRPPQPDPDDLLSPEAERVIEAALWTVSLAMLHFTFDVLVQHQYGEAIIWPSIIWRAIQAWCVFVFIFYVLHPHKANPTPLPFIPLRYQAAASQIIFFAISVCSGCYLIYVTNMKGYLANMKRAPPLGCLWLWAVLELDLPWAAGSCALAGVFLYVNGYEYM